jgi:hypothetical protein
VGHKSIRLEETFLEKLGTIQNNFYGSGIGEYK